MTRTTPSEAFRLDRLTTPIGTMLLVTDEDGVLRALDFDDYEARMMELLRLHYGAVTLAAGRAPKAMRAVGHANGSNPVSVVIPCHRLIGANGSLIKYGGGLHRKQWLLRHEGVEA